MIADELLVATGRRPIVRRPRSGRRRGRAGRPRASPILTETLRTTNRDVWVAGDATGDLLFTHVGTYEAELVVKDILGHPERRDYRVIPRVTFCDPEVASVGLDGARRLATNGHEVITSVVPFDDNERADIEGAHHGLVKLVAERGTGELLGGHIVGEEAGALIHQIVLMMAARATAPRPSPARSTPIPPSRSP